ncbi:hypothetical protein QYM36_002232 [Artemia franciscana]|uniref:Uncharacterized protein n=1 Tax=Artemia franciscana TaxID=6661 RepID=A0AA88I9D4_ARTSF|nr:hypothetical protein QYM36_002232 [Artemia franciscana]
MARDPAQNKYCDTVHRRKIKRFSYEEKDESVNSGKQSFKINFFFVMLNTAISSLEEGFELMDNHRESFKFIYDIQSLQNFADKEELNKACKHLQIVLSVGEDCNVNNNELFEELQIFAEMLPSKSLPAHALSYITQLGYMDKFSNVIIALKIILTFLVSVVHDERSFFKSK